MSSAAAMTVVVIVLAVALIALFSVVWLKDRDRSVEEAHDAERLETDPQHQHPRPAERSGRVRTRSAALAGLPGGCDQPMRAATARRVPAGPGRGTPGHAVAV